MNNSECYITADCGGSNIVLYAVSPDYSDGVIKSLKYPSLNASLDPEECGRLIAEAVYDFSRECFDASYTRVSRILIGAAGCGNTSVADSVLKSFVDFSRKLPSSADFISESAKIAVISDAELAMCAAFSDSASAASAKLQVSLSSRGLLVISGTGSVCFLKLGRKIYRRGGFGPVIGDPGSGLGISLKLISQILSARDEVEMYGSSFVNAEILSLSDELLRLYSLNSTADIPAFATSASRSTVAKAAEIVIRAAEFGNSAAERILRDSVRPLADFAASLISFAFSADSSYRSAIPLKISLHGGLFAGSEYYASYFRSLVLSRLNPTLADELEFAPLRDISHAVYRFDFNNEVIL